MRRVVFRKEDVTGLQWRVFIDLEPAPLFMRRSGGAHRWEMVAEMDNGARVVLFGGAAKNQVKRIARLLINIGINSAVTFAVKQNKED